MSVTVSSLKALDSAGHASNLGELVRINPVN